MSFYFHDGPVRSGFVGGFYSR